MRIPFLKGKRIYLSSLTPKADLKRYMRWLNDQPTTLFMGSGRFPVTSKSLAGYIKHYEDAKDGLLLGIFTSSGGHIGNITLHMLDYRNRNGEIGIIIGEKTARGKGYGSEAIRLVAEHAFAKLNLHKINAGIVDGNGASLKAFKKIGFKIEGTLRDQFLLDGKYLRVYRLGLLAKDLKRGN